MNIGYSENQEFFWDYNSQIDIRLAAIGQPTKGGRGMRIKRR